MPWGRVKVAVHLSRRQLLRFLLFGSALLLPACGSPRATKRSQREEPSPSSVGVRPEQVLAQFGALWQHRDYAGMYGLLHPQLRAKLSFSEFQAFYENLATTLLVQEVLFEPVSSLIADATEADVGFRKVLRSPRYGSLEELGSARLRLEQGQWWLLWHPSLILASLDYGCRLVEERTWHPRGSICDRAGNPLATGCEVSVVGVVPGEIEDEEALLTVLSRVLGQPPSKIRDAYVTGAMPHWFVPVAELEREQLAEHYAELASTPGIHIRSGTRRCYPQGELAGHITGYVGPIQADQLTSLAAKGYGAGDTIGQAGLEASCQDRLAGKPSIGVHVLCGQGTPRGRVAEAPGAPGETLYTTLDLELQQFCFELLGGRRGAIVVLDARDGAVLALASSPSYDPNGFVAGMPASEFQKLVGSPERPLLQRATQGEYALGSVFKVVTMAAALASGLAEPETPLQCSGAWEGLGAGYVVRCWKPGGHGTITLKQALSASCNVAFAQVGKLLHDADPMLLPQMGRAFGFGAQTGIGFLPEASGMLPDPAWKAAAVGEPWFAGDSVNLAIGQGWLLATPLQVAAMMAAVAGSAGWRKPYLAKEWLTSAGAAEVVPVPEPRPLPLEERHLQALREALAEACSTPLGTAYGALGHLRITTAGKTGTAENPPNEPHAWFAGYAPADSPELAVAVVIENGGQGSLVAAPLFGRIVERFAGS